MKKTVLISLGIVLFTSNSIAQKHTDTTTKQEVKKGKTKPKRGHDPFVDLDTNKDGKISKAEARGPISKDFNKIDLNKDGLITREELDKAPKPKRGKGRPPRK